MRKRGTHMWMNPGGKPEPGESGAQCAARELAEELGLGLDPDRLEFLGEHRAMAANEPDHVVVALAYRWPEPIDAEVAPSAEIEAVRWVTPADLSDPSLAPLFVGSIAPLLGGDWLG